MKKGKSRIKNSFLSGLFFLLPVVLTLYAVYYIARFVCHGLHFIIALVPASYAGSPLFQSLIIITSIITIFFVIVLIGIVIRTVVGRCTEQTAPDTEREYSTVFMPTTPNPTSGFLMIFPEEEIRHTGLAPGDAFKLIMSGGIVKE